MPDNVITCDVECFPSEDNPERKIIAAERLALYLDAESTVEPVARLAHRYYIEGFDPWAIGEAMRVSSEEAQRLIWQARKKIMRYIRKRAGTDG
ncbi:hypothetical protein M0R72_06300 [Candidatus Pacearchaeota archaeon]|jgi:DNA-directed RNA polymerase specialized sigma24 family protein|nr:hypothetical protein [Candidatus Pacearchaeota archaeon]